jgi:transposase
VLERICAALSDDPDFESALIDGTIVKVHRHGAGASGGTHNQAIGRSLGGLTTKIVALVNALGNPARFVLLPGQRHDSVGVAPLITGVDFDALIADKAFDDDALRALLNERGAIAVIPAKADRKAPIPHDVEMYRWRHLIENCFQRRVPSDRRLLRQSRHQLRRRDLSRRSFPRPQMNVYRL